MTRHKKKAPFLTVYTVSTVDDKRDDPMESNTIGSYVSRRDAIRECATHILDRMELRQDIREAFYLDENHKVRDELAKNFEIGWVDSVLLGHNPNFSWNENKSYKDLRKSIFNYLTDVIGGDSFYRIEAQLGDEGTCVFQFDISENDVEGMIEAWTCVTSGSTDCEDEEFEQPFPEVFLSKKEAVDCALDDLKYQMSESGESQEDMKQTIAEAEKNFKEFGKFSYSLNDGAVRRWDIWSTPITLSGFFPVMSQTKRG